MNEEDRRWRYYRLLNKIIKTKINKETPKGNTLSFVIGDTDKQMQIITIAYYIKRQNIRNNKFRCQCQKQKFKDG